MTGDGRKAAGGFRRRAAPLVGHDATASLPPRSEPCIEIRSATTVASHDFESYRAPQRELALRRR